MNPLFTCSLISTPKYVKQVSAFFIMLLCSISALAQTGSIQGAIFAENRSPIAGITIALEGTKHQTSTDNEGYFYFANVTPGNYILVASGIGYSARSQQISVEAGKPATVNFQLTTTSSVLEQVVVSSRQRTVTATSSALTRNNTAMKDLPQHVQVIDRTTLQEQQVFSVDQALKNAAGVNLSTSYGSLKWDIAPGTSLQVNGTYNRDRSSSNWMPEVPVFSELPLFSLPREFNYSSNDSKYEVY